MGLEFGHSIAQAQRSRKLALPGRLIACVTANHGVARGKPKKGVLAEGDGWTGHKPGRQGWPGRGAAGEEGNAPRSASEIIGDRHAGRSSFRIGLKQYAPKQIATLSPDQSHTKTQANLLQYLITRLLALGKNQGDLFLSGVVFSKRLRFLGKRFDNI